MVFFLDYSAGEMATRPRPLALCETGHRHLKDNELIGAVELFAPLRGLNLNFERDRDPGRDIEL
jgi:hypothetical protein